MTPEQKAERLNWCLTNRDNEFEFFVFVDESKLTNHICKLYHMRKKSARPDCIIMNSTPFKLNIWGGISKRGATEFIVRFELAFYSKKI